ncbi:MAG TPA: WYL domain-containing protein [Longimicrobiales bacterium]|nr:WYL domain-containing protein [Longimicrobiales bacterium]
MAKAQVERLLQLIPLAGREGGIAYDELAAALGIDRRQLDRDLETLTARDFYLPGGTVNDLQVMLDDDRVRIWTTGHLQRPTRLTAGEAAALDLGLRMLAAEREEPGLADGMRALLERLARAVPDDVLDRFAADGDPGAPDAVRALIIEAARRRLRVRLRYLKSDADAPEDREVDPYTVAYAEGRWYVIGYSPERDDIRQFRTDRILEATVGDQRFESPADFDPADYISDGRVYRADQEIEVLVRYGGRVAPWLIERGEGEPQDDGGVVVRHRVADPAWIVAEVLKYGRDARVVEPAWVAGLVREAVSRLS